jgi:hypothetical protein
MKNTSLVIIGFCLSAMIAFAQDTNIKYSGQPVASAIAPSVSAFGQNCFAPYTGAVSSSVFGISTGGVYNSDFCERMQLSSRLEALGLPVAAVMVLIDSKDLRTWNAMLMSGVVPPYAGLTGDAALNEWIKRHPKRFEDLYGFVPATVAISPATTESK